MVAAATGICKASDLRNVRLTIAARSIASPRFGFLRAAPTINVIRNLHSNHALRAVEQRFLPGTIGSTRIKHDGYRLIVQRKASACGCSPATATTGADRFPLITEAALRNRNSAFVIDGEAVLLDVDGR